MVSTARPKVSHGVHPKNYAYGFWFVVICYQYASGLLHWDWGNNNTIVQCQRSNPESGKSNNIIIKTSEAHQNQVHILWKILYEQWKVFLGRLSRLQTILVWGCNLYRDWKWGYISSPVATKRYLCRTPSNIKKWNPSNLILVPPTEHIPEDHAC